MQSKHVEAVARQMLKDMRGFMEQATSIVQAADSCADIDAATKIVMDFEEPASRALEMFKAMLLIKREYSDNDFE